MRRGFSNNRRGGIALACLVMLVGLHASIGAATNQHPDVEVHWFESSQGHRVDYSEIVTISWNLSIAGSSSEEWEVHIPLLGHFRGLVGEARMNILFPVQLTLHVLENGVTTKSDVARLSIDVNPSSYPREFLTVFRDNVLVWRAGVPLTQRLRPKNQGDASESNWHQLARQITSKVEDVYDFASFVQPKSAYRDYGMTGYAQRIWVEPQGVEPGRSESASESSRRYYRTTKLRLFTLHPKLEDFIDTGRGSIFHEIMHAWANRGIPTQPGYRNWGRHWGVSSANGVLGGFDYSTLEEVRRGASKKWYAAMEAADCIEGSSTTCPGRRYSPLELYLAGWAPESEVPDLWVAYDGRFTYAEGVEKKFRNASKTLSGKTLFSASDVRVYSIRQIQRFLGGPRIPDYHNAQKNFRLITIMLMDHQIVPSMNELAELSDMLGNIERRNSLDPHGRTFWEVASGRATLKTGGVSDTVIAPVTSMW